MRILVCGDRNWTDREKIAQYLRVVDMVAELIHTEYDGYPGLEKVVIHGAARGADTIAGEEAARLDFEVKAYPADWSIGRTAGVIRNQVMLEDGKPDLVLAFHSNIEESKGTKDMVRRAPKAGIPTEVIS